MIKNLNNILELPQNVSLRKKGHNNYCFPSKIHNPIHEKSYFALCLIENTINFFKKIQIGYFFFTIVSKKFLSLTKEKN